MDDQATFAKTAARPNGGRAAVLGFAAAMARGGLAFPTAGADRAVRGGFRLHAEKLIPEIDGDSHFSEEGMARDFPRTAYCGGLVIL